MVSVALIPMEYIRLMTSLLGFQASRLIFTGMGFKK